MSANPNNGGSAHVGNTPGTTQDTYTDGQNCTVHAIANPDYNFVNWTENGTPVSTEADYTFPVTGDRNLVANFQEIQCIDTIAEIVRKYHTAGNDSYVLVLVYPNQDDIQEDENDYTYEWLYSEDEFGKYDVLTEGTWNKQYYYRGYDKRIKDGWYKVRITKRDCATPVETKPCQVTDNGGLILYPNPSRRGSEIMDKNDCNGPASLTIYSTDGRVLHTQTVTDSQATIGISLPQGI